MELLPKAIVAGVYAAVPPTAVSPTVTEDRINRIWAEVAPRQGYRQLQIAPDGSSAQFIGTTGDDGVAIQLPVIQVRSAIEMTQEKAAESVQIVLKSVAKHLGLNQFFNLGIKHIYHAPVADRDARTFVQLRLLGKDEASLNRLLRGGDFWTGLKFGLNAPDGSLYVLTLEPWLADNQAIFVDLDAQFPGLANLDSVSERAREAHEYARTAVKEYLDTAEETL